LHALGVVLEEDLRTGGREGGREEGDEVLACKRGRCWVSERLSAMDEQLRIQERMEEGVRATLSLPLSRLVPSLFTS
jgi:hypothetical protein